MPDVSDVLDAVAAAGPRCLLTGSMAARALGLRWIPEPTMIQLLVPAAVRRVPRPGVHLRRTAAYEELDADAWIWNGARVAPPSRVVLDAGLGLRSLRDVRGVVLAAVWDGVTSVGEQRQQLLREPRNGSALLRRALVDAERGAASPPEAEFADDLRGCGVPFLLNPELKIDGRLVGCPDGYFPGLGAGWEVDSRERHEGDESFDETLARHGVFGGYGILLAHPTPRRIRQRTAETVASVLGVARPRMLLPPDVREPRGLEVIPRGPLLR